MDSIYCQIVCVGLVFLKTKVLRTTGISFIATIRTLSFNKLVWVCDITNDITLCISVSGTVSNPQGILALQSFADVHPTII